VFFVPFQNGRVVVSARGQARGSLNGAVVDVLKGQLKVRHTDDTTIINETKEEKTFLNEFINENL
jgi:hypothetical protein